METTLNADANTGKDVTGASYVDMSGYSPETGVDYTAYEEDALFPDLWAIYKGLKKDDDSLTFYKLEALLDIEVSETNTVKNASGEGFVVPVKAAIQSVGGDTSGLHINVNFYEDHSIAGRTEGTVTVTNRQPTFEEAGTSEG